MNFDIKFSQNPTIKNLSIIINFGDPILLKDGTTLVKYSSGLFKNFQIQGDKLIEIELGDDLEVSDEIANYCRNNWEQVYNIFPFNEFKNTDFYRSPKTKLGDLELNFWYCGADFSCGIHNKHDFYEIHTQVLGRGEMQKFHENNEDSLYYREILNPGQTHTPFYDKNHIYPYHRYKSITKCIWLAIESPTKLL